MRTPTVLSESTFPRGTISPLLPHQDFQTVMDKLNNRSGKCLGMNTPNEVFFNINPIVALGS